MNPAQGALALATALFVGMVACLEGGYRIGRRANARHPEWAHEGVGAIEAAVFALFGLLLGFSFAGATSRLDARREQIVQEANAIGTAYLRLDLAAPNDQPEMRRLFRDYLDARLSMYAKLPDLRSADRELARAEQIQREIWSRAVSSSRTDAAQDVGRVLLPALNDMMDLTTARSIALHTRLPSLILALLISLALMSGLLAGYAMAKRHHRSWLHTLLYAGFVAMTVYTVLDLDNPRSGLIRLDAADNAIVKLRDSIR
ncbi:MAG: DUF4239 domain-containing protein [Candidatus Eiseniibacteriota bacterium]